MHKGAARSLSDAPAQPDASRLGRQWLVVDRDQRHMLPASALFGALLLSVASVVSKLIMPGTVFPIGIITALVGVPFFGWLVLTKGRVR